MAFKRPPNSSMENINQHNRILCIVFCIVYCDCVYFVFLIVHCDCVYFAFYITYCVYCVLCFVYYASVSYFVCVFCQKNKCKYLLSKQIFCL